MDEKSVIDNLHVSAPKQLDHPSSMEPLFSSYESPLCLNEDSLANSTSCMNFSSSNYLPKIDSDISEVMSSSILDKIDHLCREMRSEKKLEILTCHTFSTYLKGCKWSPDGTCLLTNSEDKTLRLFNLPEEWYGGHLKPVSFMNPVLEMRESSLIYDYCWLPGMSSSDPNSCRLVSTCRDTPIHMWDAYTGDLNSTYRAYDQMDEITAAYSLQFSLDGSKLYCGYNKCIRVFHTDRPGRDSTVNKTYTKKDGGQSGIISCLAMNPSDCRMYAAGSYSRSVAIYNDDQQGMLFMFQGQIGGITHITFSSDGNRIYAGGRKDPEILCWDMRRPGEILFTCYRTADTNQRIYFDLDRTGKTLITGNTDGNITVWDTTANAEVSSEGEPTLKPVGVFAAHKDVVNGVSIHPSLPLLASASGQRHVSPGAINRTSTTSDLSSDSESDNDSESDDEYESSSISKYSTSRRSFTSSSDFENSLKLWDLNNCLR